MNWSDEYHVTIFTSNATSYLPQIMNYKQAQPYILHNSESEKKTDHPMF